MLQYRTDNRQPTLLKLALQLAGSSDFGNSTRYSFRLVTAEDRNGISAARLTPVEVLASIHHVLYVLPSELVSALPVTVPHLDDGANTKLVPPSHFEEDGMRRLMHAAPTGELVPVISVRGIVVDTNESPKRVGVSSVVTFDLHDSKPPRDCNFTAEPSLSNLTYADALVNATDPLAVVANYVTSLRRGFATAMLSPACSSVGRLISLRASSPKDVGGGRYTFDLLFFPAFRGAIQRVTVAAKPPVCSACLAATNATALNASLNAHQPVLDALWPFAADMRVVGEVLCCGVLCCCVVLLCVLCVCLGL